MGNNGELLAGLGHRMGSSENPARSSMMSEVYSLIMSHVRSTKKMFLFNVCFYKQAVYEWADMDEDILALEIDRLHSAECDDNYT